MNNQKIHESVMLSEVVKSLHIKKEGVYIDGTLGTAGHTLAILKSGGFVLGIEADPKMLTLASKRIESEIADKKKYKLVNQNFVNIDSIARENGLNQVDGIILDLGVTNLHLLDESRGFSFSKSNPDVEFDMRLDSKTQGVKAIDLLNLLRQDQLEKLFDVTMEKSPSRWLSKNIVEARKIKPFETVSDFLEICENLRSEKIHINRATLPFLALRIAVNSELDNLREVLPKSYSLLKQGCRLLVITFHSGEDRIVKEFASGSELLLPTDFEIESNPRSRSAKLRIIIKK